MRMLPATATFRLSMSPTRGTPTVVCRRWARQDVGLQACEIRRGRGKERGGDGAQNDKRWHMERGGQLVSFVSLHVSSCQLGALRRSSHGYAAVITLSPEHRNDPIAPVHQVTQTRQHQGGLAVLPSHRQAECSSPRPCARSKVGKAAPHV